MAHPPLSLAFVPAELGGLYPQVELLLVDVGVGVVIAGEGPVDRFARTLKTSMATLGQILGDPERMPRGWWGTMDVPLRPRRRPRVSRYPEFPYLRLRHRPRAIEWSDPTAKPAPSLRGSFRTLVRESPLGRFFEPLRPYDAYLPGPPSRPILQAVRDAGFEYAFTKSGFGPVPRVVTGIDGLTVLNHTAGRWDGWTPFVTVNGLVDVQSAERQLARRKGPGWLVGMLDTCLWTFTGPLWGRATELDAIARLLVDGGRSGRLVNVTPRTVARYARLLGERGDVASVAAEGGAQ
jgi:hypothetical protein